MAADHIIDIIFPQPGIQRDGTKFDTKLCIDGQWVRFYKGRPKKIGGQVLIDPGNIEIIRNVYNVDQQNDVTDCYLGRASTLSFTSVSNGISEPEVDRTPVGFATDPNNNWTFDRYTVLSNNNSIILLPNPIFTTNTSATVTVTVPSTSSLTTGHYVTISGAHDTNGITAAELNISAQITVVSPITFTYTSGGTATSTGYGGGNVVSYLPNLANNPIGTTNASNVITVTVTSTANLSVGETITISGSTDVNNITASQINITTTITSILSGTTFTYNTVGPPTANATGVGGGTGVTLLTSATTNYIIAHAAPNVMDINSSAQTLIYWGDTESINPLVPISVSNPVASGGIVVLYPYFFKYGNDGVLTWTTNPGGNWSDAIAAPVAGTKIVKGLKTRGGSNAPSGLFWTLNALIRATFVGGTEIFNFDTIQEDISLLSQNCIVTQNNIFYWIGHNQFYLYNGIIRIIPNETNKVTFFKNLNMKYRNKVWGIYKEEYHEIWWHYPSGNNTECTDVIIYNIDGQFWFDTVHGRSAGTTTGLYPYPLEADSVGILNQYNPTPISISLGNNPLATTINLNTVVVTIPSTTILRTGMLVTIKNATGFNGLSASQLNLASTPITVINNTSFSYRTSINSTGTGSGGGAAITYSYENLNYGLWQEETGTDRVIYGRSYAIDSYFETNIMTWFEKAPTDDRQMRIRRIEPDFVLSGDMTMVINTRDFPQSPVSTSQTYTFTPQVPVIELNKIDTNNMGRLVSFRFESNMAGGDYFMGKTILNFAPGDVRP
jgi:hypothetical protein